MRFLVLFACALAVASAGYVSPVVYAGHYGYHGPQHLPLINHEGVPVDTAAVQHATAAHLAHKANVHARNGDYHHVHHAVAPVVAHYGHGAVVAHAAPYLAHTAYSHGIVGDHHGYTHHGLHGLHYRKRRGIYAAPLAYHYGYHGAEHLPIINHEGVPVDTAAVQHATAAHLAHKANVHARNGDYHHVHHAVAPVAYAHGYAAHSYAAPWAHYY